MRLSTIIPLVSVIAIPWATWAALGALNAAEYGEGLVNGDRSEFTFLAWFCVLAAWALALAVLGYALFLVVRKRRYAEGVLAAVLLILLGVVTAVRAERPPESYDRGFQVWVGQAVDADAIRQWMIDRGGATQKEIPEGQWPPAVKAIEPTFVTRDDGGVRLWWSGLRTRAVYISTTPDGPPPNDGSRFRSLGGGVYYDVWFRG